MFGKTKLMMLVTAMCLMGFAIRSGQAALIVQTGNIPQTDDNVISGGSCVAHIDGPALTIQGCLNGSHSTLVNFTSDENIVYAAGGQAKIDATDAGYSRLRTEVVGNTFQTLILNIETSADGEVSFTDGTSTSSLFSLDGNGNNFFTITGDTFPFISFTTFDTSGLNEADIVDDTKQIRIGGIECAVGCGPNPIPAPEPVTLALFGFGLAGLGFYRNRRRST